MPFLIKYKSALYLKYFCYYFKQKNQKKKSPKLSKLRKEPESHLLTVQISLFTSCPLRYT